MQFKTKDLRNELVSSGGSLKPNKATDKYWQCCTQHSNTTTALYNNNKSTVTTN